MRARLTIAIGAATAMVTVLTVQFLLGMGVNLTVHVPHARFGFGSMMGVMRGQPLLVVHMMLGMLTAALAVVAVLTAAASARASVVAPAAVGLVAVLVAGYGGIQFLLTGSNTASFTMAAGFVVAYAAYFVELVNLVWLGAASSSTATSSSSGWASHAEQERRVADGRRASW